MLRIGASWEMSRYKLLHISDQEAVILLDLQKLIFCDSLYIKSVKLE